MTISFLCFIILSSYLIGIIFLPWGDELVSLGEMIVRNGVTLSAGRGVATVVAGVLINMIPLFGLVCLASLISLITKQAGFTLGLGIVYYLLAMILQAPYNQLLLPTIMNKLPSYIILGNTGGESFTACLISCIYIVLCTILALRYFKKMEILS